MLLEISSYQSRPPNLWRPYPFRLANPYICHQLRQAHQQLFESNDVPDTDPFILWSTYKAYMRGILIKMCTYVKRQRTRQIEKVLASIKQKE